MCFPHRDASTYMQHGLLGPSRDIDLRSAFDLDLLRSTCICLMRLDERNTMVLDSCPIFLTIVIQKIARKATLTFIDIQSLIC